MKLTKEEDKDHKTLVKEYKRLEIFIIIFMAIAICLGTFYFNVICFGKECENKSPTPLIVVNHSKTNQQSNYIEKKEDENWVNYLLSQHILEAKITRVRSTDLGDSEELNKTITISMDDVKEILTKLESSKLSKTWSDGRGGPVRDHLIITYEKNNQNYAFEIYYGDISVNKLDNEFKDILENIKYEEKNTEYNNIPGAFYIYDIENFSETIFDKYFN